jgi:hypothetical protein
LSLEKGLQELRIENQSNLELAFGPRKSRGA